MVSLVAGEAGAQQARPTKPPLPVRLVYTRGPGAEACPGPEVLRAYVARRMGGVDPFDVIVARRLDVTIARSEGELRVAMHLLDEQGDQVWEENTIHTRDSCAALVHALGLSIAIRLEPEPEPVACEAPKPAPCPECPESLPGDAPRPCDDRHSVWPPEPPIRPALDADDFLREYRRRLAAQHEPPPGERSAAAVRIGVAVWPELVVQGWGSFGFTASLGGRVGVVSFGAETHANAPLGTPTVYPGVGPVRFSRLSAAFPICAHVSYALACALVDVGRFFVGGSTPLPATLGYFAAGGRAGVELPIVHGVHLQIVADVRALIGASYTPPGMATPIWAPSAPGAGLGVGFLWERW
jgi:hypothetical protein